MKVKIGKYPSHFSPFDLAEKICFWAKNEVDEYGFPRKPKWVRNFGEWLSYGSIEPEAEVGQISELGGRRKTTLLFKFLVWLQRNDEQKVKVHIDRWDTWSMDYSLGLIALPMLKQLKDTKQGAPDVDDDDVPEELKSTSAPALTEEQKNCGHPDDNHFKRWDYVLDEMIFAFEARSGDNQDWEKQFRSGNTHLQFKKLENGMSEVIEGPNHTGETDWDGRKAYEDRIQNGFRLFGKYYQNLWD